MSRPYRVPKSSTGHNTGLYLIYPPIKDERLSRPKLMQIKNLLRVATKVPAIPVVSWLSQPSTPLGIVGGVNNLPTVVTLRSCDE